MLCFSLSLGIAHEQGVEPIDITILLGLCPALHGIGSTATPFEFHRGERGENKRANASAVIPYRLQKTDNQKLSVFFVFYNAELAINGLLGYSGVEANFLISTKKEKNSRSSLLYPLRLFL